MLNERQKVFVDFYIQSCNATEAAKMAGYSPKTAYSIGQRLLKNVEVSDAISERLRELESERIATDKEILVFLSSVLRGEVSEQVIVQIGNKGNFHSELIDKKPCIKDRLQAASQLSRLFEIQKTVEEISDDDVVIVELPAKNAPIEE